MPGGREMNPRARPPAALMNGELVDPSEDRYLQKLHNSTEQNIANNYFRSKRADKLLIKTQDDKGERQLILSLFGITEIFSPVSYKYLLSLNVYSCCSGSDYPVIKLAWFLVSVRNYSNNRVDVIQSGGRRGDH